MAASKLELESQAALGWLWAHLPAVWFGRNPLLFRCWTFLYIEMRAKSFYWTALLKSNDVGKVIHMALGTLSAITSNNSMR